MQRGLCGAQCGIGFEQRVVALVELALRDCMLLIQALRALVFAACVRGARLRRGHLRLRALDVGRIGRRVDGEQQIVLLDQRTFAEVHGLHRARRARADLHVFHRFEAAGELVPRGHIALHHRGHRHRHGLRLGGGRSGLGLAAVQPESSGRHGGDRGERGGGCVGAAAQRRLVGLVHVGFLEEWVG